MVRVLRYNRTGEKMCGKPDCPIVISAAFLMCAPHWFQVPQPLRLQIHAALRTWRNATPETEGAKLQALQVLQAEAIALVS